MSLTQIPDRDALRLQLAVFAGNEPASSRPATYSFAVLSPAARGEGEPGERIVELAARWGFHDLDREVLAELRREPEDDQPSWR